MNSVYSLLHWKPRLRETEKDENVLQLEDRQTDGCTRIQLYWKIDTDTQTHIHMRM